VEHEFAGVPCGLMDPTASLQGKSGFAVLLDCRTRKVEHISLPLEKHSLLVVDSGVRHDLAATEYAKRQTECREATEYFRQIDPKVAALRDVVSQSVQRHALQMSPLAAARARHVTSENERTQAAAAALRKGDIRSLGELMRASHRSLRDDYQVSCKELDDLVRTLDGVEGVLGARMTGGGFGGCAIALVRDASVTAVAEALRERYDPTHVKPASVVRVRPGAGARIELG
jgi:galactokinase